MHEALELGREHQVHDRECEKENQIQLIAGARVLAGFAIPHECRFGRELARHGVAIPVDRLAHGVVFGEPRPDFDIPQAIEPRQPYCAGDLFEPHDVGEWDQLVAAIRTHTDIGEIGDGFACVVARLQHHVVLAAAIDVARHDARAECGLERASDRLQRDAEVRRAIAIHCDANLRLAFLEVGIDVLEPRIRLGERQQNGLPLRQAFVVRPADDCLDRLAGAAPAKAAGLSARYAHTGQLLARFGKQGLTDLACRMLAIVPVLQNHDGPRSIHIARGRGATSAGHAQHDPGNLALLGFLVHDGFQAPRVVIHIVEARPFRPFQIDEHAADIRDWCEFAWHRMKGEGTEHDQSAERGEHEPGTCDQRAQATIVELRESTEEPVGCAGHATAFELVGGQLAGQHRRERQRNQRREQHRCGEGEAEFTEQPAEITGQE